MAKRLYWHNADDMAVLAGALRGGEVVISSTDTVYGFLSDIVPACYDSICNLKEVGKRRPFLVLISGPAKLSMFVDGISDDIRRFLDFCWPGPLTVICKAKEGLGGHMVSERGTIALRCPQHDGLLAMLESFDGLFSTSANRTALPAPTRYDEIEPMLLDKVSYVVSDAVDRESGKPSSIIDFSQRGLTGDGLPFTVVREGVYSTTELKDLYEKFKRSF